jgi:hypothetical protein
MSFNPTVCININLCYIHNWHKEMRDGSDKGLLLPKRSSRNGESAMVFIPTPHCIEVKAIGDQNGIPVVNVWHVDNGATVTDADLGDVADAVETWFKTYPLPYMHNSYTLNQVVATDVSAAGGHQVVNNLTSANVGGNSSDPANAAAAVVYSWRSARIGRSFRGRTYIGALPAVSLEDAQNVTSGIVTAYATHAANLIDAIAALGKTLVILSKYANGVARVVGLMTEIIGVIVDSVVDSQRKRNAN